MGSVRVSVSIMVSVVLSSWLWLHLHLVHEGNPSNAIRPLRRKWLRVSVDQNVGAKLQQIYIYIYISHEFWTRSGVLKAKVTFCSLNKYVLICFKAGGSDSAKNVL